MKTTALAIVVTIAGCGSAIAQEHFYVRPPPNGDDQASGRTPNEAVATLTGARNRVREFRATHPPATVPYVIHVGGGVYELPQTFTLGPEDSGYNINNMLVYRAADLGDPGGDRAVVSGGTAVSSWAPTSMPQVWTAAVALDPVPEQGPRDLYRAPQGQYDNGQRLTRARFPNVNPAFPYDPSQWMRLHAQTLDGGKWKITAKGDTGLICPSPPSAPYCATTSSPPQDGVYLDVGVEVVARRKFVAPRQVVYVNPPFEWGAGPSGEPTFWSPGRLGAEASNISISGNHEFYVEGAFEWIDMIDEWAFTSTAPPDVGQLSVKAANDPGGSTMVVPRLPTLVRLERANFVAFEDITFCYTNRPKLPNGYNPEFCGHAAAGPMIPNVQKNDQLLVGAIEFVGTQACLLERCTIAHTGGIGVVVQSYKHGSGHCDWTFALDNAISECDVLDCGGTGVYVGSLKNPYLTPVANTYPTLCAHWVRTTSVMDCRILGFGAAFHDGAGVYIRKADDTLISHNEVGSLSGSTDAFACRYSGIVSASLGPGEAAHNHKAIIEYNHVHHVMSRLSDGAGIYVEGNQPDSVIRGNWVHAMPRDPRSNTDCLSNAGLYFDRGAKTFAVDTNVIEAIGNYGYSQPALCCGDAVCQWNPRVGTLIFNTAGGAWPDNQVWPDWQAGDVPNYFDVLFGDLFPNATIPPGGYIIFDPVGVPPAEVLNIRANAGPR